MAADSIQTMSDLHLETSNYSNFAITPKAPHLALLGDIGLTKDPGLFTFLTNQLSAFKTIFYILGNHEPYHSSWEDSKTKMLDFEREAEVKRLERPGEVGKFGFMDQKRYYLSDKVTVLGCTLFSRVGEEHEERVSKGLNDFLKTQNWTVPDHNASFTSDLTFLNTQVSQLLSSNPKRKIIILTHHGPTIDTRVIDPSIKGSALSSAFISDLKGEKCWESGNVKAWTFGHTHFNCDFLDVMCGWEGRELRGLTDMKGYSWAEAVGWSGGKVVRV